MSTRDEPAAVNEAFPAALANQDADRVASLYTNDARLLFAGTPIVRGRAAIGRYHTPTGRGKYVVVYERQADGSLRLAVDAASSDGPRQAE